MIPPPYFDEKSGFIPPPHNKKAGLPFASATRLSRPTDGSLHFADRNIAILKTISMSYAA
jgi:hypothetical protein